LCVCFDNSHFGYVKVNIVYNIHFPDDDNKDVKHFFSFEKSVYFCSLFLNWLFIFLVFSFCFSSLYNLVTNLQLDMSLLNIDFPICRVPLHFSGSVPCRS